MKLKKKTRIILDAVLTMLLIASMLIQYTGNLLHEIIGAVFIMAIILHLCISAAWVKRTARDIGRKKASRRRTALFSIGIILAVSMAVLAISSIAISGVLASAGFVFPVGEYPMWVYLHALSSYTLCAVIAVHLAMHWSFIASVLRLRYAAENKRIIGAGVYAGALAGAGLLAGYTANVPLPQGGISATTSIAATATAIGQEEQPSEGSDDAGASTKRSKREHRPGEDWQAAAEVSASQDAETWERIPSDGDGEQVQGAAETEEEQVQSPSENGEEGPTAIDICTLCPKRCSLSSPRCDRPYAAGLIQTGVNR